MYKGKGNWWWWWWLVDGDLLGKVIDAHGCSVVGGCCVLGGETEEEKEGCGWLVVTCFIDSI
jgi:hypothetical protein